MTEDRDYPLLTQCPGCQTVFRITGAILRAAHGQVRCGRCNTQFDAIQNVFEQDELLEEQAPARESAAEKTEFMPSGSASDDATAFMPSEFDSTAATHEQITMEGDRFKAGESPQPEPRITVEDKATEANLDDSIIEIFEIDSMELDLPLPVEEASGAETESPEPGFVDNELDSEIDNESAIADPHSDELTRVRERFFDNDLQDSAEYDEENDMEASDHIDATGDGAEAFNEAIYMTGLDRALEEEHEDIRPDYLLDEDAEPEAAADFVEEPVAVEKTKMRRWSTTRKSRKQSEPPPDVLEPDLYQGDPPAQWRMGLLCAGLMLLLGVQVIHHYRQTLVRHPGFGPVLKSVYAAFGQDLEPRWDVKAYSIKQWGIVSDPQAAGVLRVRASITNNAPFAQPYPLLKLTLEDRFGTHLGTRAFKPEEYLPNAASASRLLAPGTAANVDLAIVDPGAEAVGFQFDSCLGKDDDLRCAHE